jgi:hypothetical protein
VTERKTTSEAIEPNSSYWKKLDLDPQIRAYVWYLRQNNLQAGWVCYEVIRKLSASVWAKLGKKREIPIDQYRSLLQTMPKEKTLVARRWIYVDADMSQEFENEHQTVFSQFNNSLKATKAAYQEGYGIEEVCTVWPKHEMSCDAYGGCPFLSICKRETLLSNPTFTKKEGRFNCSI